MEARCVLCNKSLERSTAYEDVIAGGGEVVGGGRLSFGLMGTVCVNCGLVFCFDCLRPGDCPICKKERGAATPPNLRHATKTLENFSSEVLLGLAAKDHWDIRETAILSLRGRKDGSSVTWLAQAAGDLNRPDRERAIAACLAGEMNNASAREALLGILEKHAGSELQTGPQFLDQRICEWMIKVLEAQKESRAIQPILRVIGNNPSLRYNGLKTLEQIDPNWRGRRAAREVLDKEILPGWVGAYLKGASDALQVLNQLDPQWQRSPAAREWFGSCWFCKTALADHSANAEWAQPWMSDKGLQQIRVQVPRCAQCRRRHRVLNALVEWPAGIVALAGVVGTFWLMSRLPDRSAVMFLAFLVGMVGTIALSFFLWRFATGLVAKVKKGPAMMEEFPVVKISRKE